MSSNLLSEPVTTSKDENFLINFLKDFYRMIIETNDFNNFEKISIEWINSYFEINDSKYLKKVVI
ncbi:hypothetical protein C1645_822530 [Glomus cerebriforme]|uniref:Uncharacterized protein n=1 Tax=Glomus cerebriforme TaxID=658196 RepID=A0A397SYB0_9GLOM|nr:hypothetical protein C1645_822530 [Glomus cerebriforme]